MSDVHFDHSEAVGKLNDLIAETTGRQDALNKRLPHFPQAAAGRDFDGYARRIQSKLATIHKLRNYRLQNISNSARAAIAEFDAAKATDEGSAAAFGQFEIGENK